MSKQTKRFKHGFMLGMAIYAAIFLILVAVGLSFFWKFIEAFEASRPLNTIDDYMAKLTEEHICDTQADLIARIDHNIMSEEACRKMICDSIEGNITYAKKPSESTDTKTVYVLRSGSRIIGTVTMTTTEIDEYNFPRWKISEEKFDFSFLLGIETYSVTVPQDFQVYVNGTKLSEEYVVQTGIEYDVLERFYDDYALPTMVTYEVEPVMGEFETQVTDAEGNVVLIDENTDYNAFLDNCTDTEKAEMKTFADSFIDRYVTFTGSANGTEKSNYSALMEYVVAGSHLAERLKMALNGLSYAHSKGDKTDSITINRQVSIGNGRYMCDITYVVSTTGQQGVVQTTQNVQIILVRTEDGLLAEALTSY